MRLNGFRCDVCCKEHLLDPTVTYRHVTSAIPDDWFMLWLGKYEDSKEPVLFCSVACLAQWAEKQVIAAVPHIAEHAKQVDEAFQELMNEPYKRLMYGNWLPGDEE